MAKQFKSQPTTTVRNVAATESACERGTQPRFFSPACDASSTPW